MADSGVAGYISGGDAGGTYTNRIDKITFSADTKTTLSATLTSARTSTFSISDTGIAGYISGGINTSNAYQSNIDKIAYPTDIKTAITATLTAIVAVHAGFADCGVF